jgi:hypothetical protein
MSPRYNEPPTASEMERDSFDDDEGEPAVPAPGGSPSVAERLAEARNRVGAAFEAAYDLHEGKDSAHAFALSAERGAWDRELEAALAEVEQARQENARLREALDSPNMIAEVLERHVPQMTNRIIQCGCGREGHLIDAKAWHRHAAAMVWNRLWAAAQPPQGGSMP